MSTGDGGSTLRRRRKSSGVSGDKENTSHALNRLSSRSSIRHSRKRLSGSRTQSSESLVSNKAEGVEVRKASNSENTDLDPRQAERSSCSDSSTFPVHPAIRDILAVVFALLILTDIVKYGFSNQTSKVIDVLDALATIAYLRDGLRCWSLRQRENQSLRWMLAVLFDELINYHCSGMVARLILQGRLVLPSLSSTVEYLLIAITCHFFPGDRLWLLIQGYSVKGQPVPLSSHISPGQWVPGDPEIHQLVATFCWGLTKLRSLLGQVSSVRFSPALLVPLGMLLCETSSLQHAYSKHLCRTLEERLHNRAWDWQNILLNSDTKLGWRDAFPVTLNGLRGYLLSQQVFGSFIVGVSLAAGATFHGPVAHFFSLCAYAGLIWRYGHSLFIPRSKEIFHMYSSFKEFLMQVSIHIPEALSGSQSHRLKLLNVIDNYSGYWKSGWKHWLRDVDVGMADLINDFFNDTLDSVDSVRLAYNETPSVWTISKDWSQQISDLFASFSLGSWCPESASTSSKRSDHKAKSLGESFSTRVMRILTAKRSHSQVQSS